MRSLVQRKMACLLIYSAWKMAVTRPSGLRYHNTCNTVDIDFCCQNFHHLMVCWIGTNLYSLTKKKRFIPLFQHDVLQTKKKKKSCIEKRGTIWFSSEQMKFSWCQWLLVHFKNNAHTDVYWFSYNLAFVGGCRRHSTTNYLNSISFRSPKRLGTGQISNRFVATKNDVE